MIIPFLEAMYGDQIFEIEEEEYRSLIDEIEFSNVSAQVYGLLRKKERLRDTPIFFQEYLKKRSENILLQNTVIKSYMMEVLSLFEMEGIDVIPLKGTLFAEQYFGNVGQRCTTDIDILVMKEDYELVQQLLINYGCTAIKSIPNHYHSSFMKLFGNKRIDIELHWSIVEGDSEDMMVNFWNNSTYIDGFRHVKRLSDFNTFLLICLHGWNHQLSTAKYLIDVVQLIHSVTIDYEEIIEYSTKFKVQKKIVNTLCIVYNIFPHLNRLNSFPYKKAVPLWWDVEILNPSGNRGRKTNFKKYLHWFKGEFYHNCLEEDTIKSSFIALKHWLIPSKEELEYIGIRNHRFYYKYKIKKLFNKLL